MTDLFRVFVSLGIPGLALGILFLLFRRFNWTLGPVPREWVGPIIITFMLVLAWITYSALTLYAPPKQMLPTPDSTAITLTRAFLDPSPTPNSITPTIWQGPCRIESFTTKPPSPQPSGMLVVLHVKAFCETDVRAIRILINDEIHTEKGGHIAPPDELSATWPTENLPPGIYQLKAEVATKGDNDWKFSASQALTFTLTTPVATSAPTSFPTAIPIFDATWKAEFFLNKDLSGSPTATRRDTAVNFIWDGVSPAVGIGFENWSARWTSNICFNSSTTAFFIQYDDALRIKIDDAIIWDGWDGPPKEFWLDYPISGCHDVILEYRQFTGGSSIRFGWYPP